MRHLGLLLAVAILAACSTPDDNTNTENPDAGTSLVRYVKLSGKVQYHPAELKWRATLPEDEQTPPSLDGAKLNVEDAIKAQSNLPPLKTVNLTSTDNGLTADFVAEDVDVKGTTLALVASVQKDGDDEFLFSGYGLGKPPFPAETDNLPVYVLSKKFMTHIASILPDDRDLDTILEEGLVLGGAMSWDHQNGVAGAKLVRLYGTGTSARVEEITEKIYYFNEDLTATVDERATTSSGMWLRLEAGSAATYTMIEKDATKFMEQGKKQFRDRLNGSRKGTALSVFFEDLATEPK